MSWLASLAIGIFDRCDESCSPMSDWRTDSRGSLNGVGQAIGIFEVWKRKIKHPATGMCSGWALAKSRRARWLCEKRRQVTFFGHMSVNVLARREPEGQRKKGRVD
jgi:hypothetical protein